MQQENLGSIFSFSRSNDFIDGVATNLFGAKHKNEGIEEKPASLLVVSLAEALNRVLQFFCGRQTMGPSSQPIATAQSH